MKVWKNVFSKIVFCETRNKRFDKFIVNRYFDYVLLFLTPIQCITLKPIRSTLCISLQGNAIFSMMPAEKEKRRNDEDVTSLCFAHKISKSHWFIYLFFKFVWKDPSFGRRFFYFLCLFFLKLVWKWPLFWKTCFIFCVSSKDVHVFSEMWYRLCTRNRALIKPNLTLWFSPLPIVQSRHSGWSLSSHIAVRLNNNLRKHSGER